MSALMVAGAAFHIAGWIGVGSAAVTLNRPYPQALTNLLHPGADTTPEPIALTVGPIEPVTDQGDADPQPRHASDNIADDYGDRIGLHSWDYLRTSTQPLDPTEVIGAVLQRDPIVFQQDRVRLQLADGLGLDADADTTPDREPVANWAKGRAA